MKKCLSTGATLLVLCAAYGFCEEFASRTPKETAEGEPHWQLFLDDHVIERSTGFRRLIHHPRPRGVVLKPDKPWETRGITPHYVGWRRDRSLECYYQAHGPGRSAIAYAVSKDGLHWEKPNLDLLSYHGSKQNNLVPCSQPWDLGQYGNIPDSRERFVIAVPDGSTWYPRRLCFGSELPDFVGDPDWREKLVEVGTRPSYKLGLHFWDDVHEEWVFMRQSPNHPPTRCVARWSTKDLQNWTLKPVLFPDAHDSTDPRYFDEIYDMFAIYAEGIALGFMHWFIGDETHPSGGVRRLIGRDTAKGTMELRIAPSRDWGYTWDRTVSREAWIPHGTEQDSYDRVVRIGCPPLRNGDEDWFYCAGYDGDHYRYNTIRGTLYTQKHNRYVSLTAGNTPRILITKPQKVTGKALQLNVDASRGEVKIGIGIDKRLRIPNHPPGDTAIMPNYMVRDRQDRTHLEEGFRLEDCKPVHVNSIEHNVEWKEATLESLLGKTVRLYILVQDAELYGFRFK